MYIFYYIVQDQWITYGKGADKFMNITAKNMYDTMSGTLAASTQNYATGRAMSFTEKDKKEAVK